MPTEKTAKVASKPKAVSPIRVANNVFIRTVTMHYTGKIVGLTRDEILLSDAAWIADSGRFAQALANGSLNEVEPFPDGVISIAAGGVIDVSDWRHALPRTVK